MSAAVAPDEIRKHLVKLDRSRVCVDPNDIVEIVESVMASVHGDSDSINVKLHEEITALAAYIQQAKAEISSIGADEIKHKFIPDAAEELSAVVTAAETATHEIFEAIETVEALSETVAPEAANVIAEAATRIYEACAFQDITGQRISKVVKMLERVEHKVGAMLAAFGEGVMPPGDQAGPACKPAPASAPAEPAAPNKDDELMNGPQLPENAMSQDEIDALLASFD
ncbi:MAG: chemotaxis protein CheZ [Alphaproteobacteria bacterium]|nr:MAG: chemotaxis protein CheZ [Alphaproteobacteria bacterium]